MRQFEKDRTAAQRKGELMEYRSILYNKESGKATVTLNRPRALNALNREIIDELLHALGEAAQDREVKVLILTGAGRAFCFGADISEFTRQREAGTSDSTLLLLEKVQEIIRLLTGMPKPVIAGINGFATGLGLDLALACDLRIAAERAKLAEAYISIGLVPDGGGTFLLPRLVGLARAAAMIFTGDPLGAAEAERLGLVNRVVPTDELPKEIEILADRLARSPSLALGLAKQALWKNLQGTLESSLQIEAQSQKACLASEDHREAVRAFLEKRAPRFHGK
jgi:2-(1,2-epoxy-1,2-dihydrophenyl)acetyl-CoA isomerase